MKQAGRGVTAQRQRVLRREGRRLHHFAHVGAVHVLEDDHRHVGGRQQVGVDDAHHVGMRRDIEQRPVFSVFSRSTWNGGRAG